MAGHSDYFPSDYRAARKRFLDLSEQQQGNVTCIRRSPAIDGELFTDICQLGAEHPRRLLVVTSALHGVEGFAGAAIQSQLLEHLNVKRLKAANAAVLLVHAMNPFGFHFLRRTNENNVDLNRNFLVTAEEFQGVPPVYRELNELLNPKTWPRREIPFQLQIAGAGLRYGISAVKQAIAVGQYDLPMGLFFGGSVPQPTVIMTEKHLLPLMTTPDVVIHLDIHTGLGKSGKAELLLDHEINHRERQLIDKLFGKTISERASNPYYARGSFYGWIRAKVPQAVSFCFEFGTKSSLSMLAALREENAAYHWTVRGSKSYLKAKQHLKEAFCPSSDQWRASVLDHSRNLLQNVIEQWLLNQHE